ncbi:UDP-N-acetylenolpyruvoylglucosamine reductase [Thioalkalivibrio versutus]|uniref:UDP-N-acetylenolpyruvoylglucosamine reductase n=1 Tax=Thioalkalivibrio versutus TaxID=106634 RepID=A0A0G3FZ73_9GAMM|nr:UDP-N-acetylmuramate dehydrogenase [Thioalkalivibrio versutus]AKJ94255.1 UDP-N-acetylenolpyruvoylglucosamine reductase [Thioalkalivibrio versutus]
MMAARAVDSPMTPFAQATRGRLQAQVPLAGLTSWRAGGPADWLFQPADLDDLVAALRDHATHAPQMPVTFLGLGSNVLIRDGGLDGLVVHLSGVLNERRRLEGDRLLLGAGLACAQAARFGAREGLVGAEFLAGIPGTVGGALRMNAGAWGGEIWPLVEAVSTVDARGELHTRTPADYTIGYRSVHGPEAEWFTGCVLQLAAGDPDVGTRRIRELLRERSAKQPLGLPSCGSVFRNPEGDHAARLVEAAGLKGLRHGAAEISPKHANFITHDGSARAADIEWLLRHAQDEVQRQFGVHLEPEVRVLGRPGATHEASEGTA